MKKPIYLTLLVMLIGLSNVSAQGFHFGLKGGVNLSNFQGSSANFNSSRITNYHAGVFTEFGISERFSIQPELLYSTMGANISFTDATKDFKNRMGYISVPLLARIYLVPNILSVDIGPQASYLLREKGNANLEDSRSYDLSITGGLTLHLIGPLFIQGRYSYGITDVKPKSDLSNRAIQLSAGLRF